MGKLFEFKRLRIEDFSEEDRAMVEKLAYIYNASMEEIYRTLNGNVDFGSNINSEVRTISLTVGSDGKPTNKLSFQTAVVGSIDAILCGRAKNLSNPTSYPSGTPLVSFTQNGGLVTVDHVTNLTAANKYELTLLSIG
jgi:hypothetical protein